MNEYLPAILVVVVLAFFVSSIRIASEHQRFAVFVAGRFLKIKGPGLLIRWPGTVERWHRISLGEKFEYVGDGLIKINEHSLPVEMEKSIQIGATAIVSSLNRSPSRPCLRLVLFKVDS